MASLFNRLTHYSTTNKVQMITQEQRSDLGLVVFFTYVSQKPANEVMHFKSGIDEDGKPYKVRNYPNYFTPTIDQLIQAFYDKLPKKKERKRIPITQKPIFSMKNI